MTAPTLLHPPSRGRQGRLDLSILVTVSALVVIGLVMTLLASSVFSVSRTGSAFTFFLRQVLWAAVGLAVLVGAASLDYRRLRGWPYLALPACWVLLGSTLHPGLGSEAGGASRWLTVGPLSVQPSEAAKLVLLVFGADVLSRKLAKLHDWRHVVLPFLAAVAVTCVLVLMQPDFGTMTILFGTALLLCFLAGADLRFLATAAGVAIVTGIPVMLAEGYRRTRLFGFFHAERDALNTGYQAVQGLVALGSGRLLGRGLGNSGQKWLFLPNPHTDFIFAILGEETGLAGTLTVLLLFALVAVLGVQAARRAPDPFGFLLAAGVTGWISLQVLVNVGAVTGVLPITGVPLPLISFGGSSLVFSLAGLGLVASVARRGQAPARPRRGGRRTR